VASRIRRKFSSLAYFARKTYWRIVTAKPSLLVIALATVGVSVFLLGGAVYNIIVPHVFIAYPYGRRVLFYYPRAVHEQVWYESLGVTILYGIGIAGFLMAYQSTKYAYKSRQAYNLLLIGCVLIFIAYFLTEIILWLKMRGPL